MLYIADKESEGQFHKEAKQTGPLPLDYVAEFTHPFDLTLLPLLPEDVKRGTFCCLSTPSLSQFSSRIFPIHSSRSFQERKGIFFL